MRKTVYRLILCLLFVSAANVDVVVAQDSNGDDENEIYVTYALNPHNDKIGDFEKAWKEHNEKYHDDSPVYAFYHETGPFAGHYQGVEGPKTWTGHENYEYTDDHGKHWIEKVHPLLKGNLEVRFWKHMKKYAQNQADQPTEKSTVTIYYVNDGEYARFARMLDDWYKANTEQNHDGRFNVYERQMHGGNEIAIVSSLEKGLAELDSPSGFKDRFTKTFSEMRWQLFLDDFDLSVKKVDVILRNRMTDLSTPQ